MKRKPRQKTVPIQTLPIGKIVQIINMVNKSYGHTKNKRSMTILNTFLFVMGTRNLWDYTNEHLIAYFSISKWGKKNHKTEKKIYAHIVG